MRARREAMQARISSLRAVIAEVPPRRSAGIACRDENVARLAALQARRAAFSIESAEMRAPISSFRARREAVPARCAAKSRCKEALRARISSLRARIAALLARREEIPSSMAALRPRRADVRSRADAPTVRRAARRLRFAAVPAGRGAMHAKEDSLPSGKASRAAFFTDPRACLAKKVPSLRNAHHRSHSALDPSLSNVKASALQLLQDARAPAGSQHHGATFEAVSQDDGASPFAG
jgi:uncharacterized coiled-coil DUF342 family protein